MIKKMVTLRQAERFHGHLGPWLILGVMAGDFAIRRLKAKKYFGINVRVWGVQKKPRSCLIDGLQLSTGATYGKGNIQKLNGPRIKMQFNNSLTDKKIILRFHPEIMQDLKKTRTHKEAESLAARLYKTDSSKIFQLTPIT